MVMNVSQKIAQCFTIWININKRREWNFFNDKDLNIKWKTKTNNSKRDRQTYSFAEFKKITL